MTLIIDTLTDTYKYIDTHTHTYVHNRWVGMKEARYLQTDIGHAYHTCIKNLMIIYIYIYPVYIYIYIYVLKSIIDTQTDTHKYIHTHIRTYMHAYIQKKRIHIYIQTDIRTCVDNR